MGAHYNRKDFLDALFFAYCRDKGGFIMARISDRHMAKTTTRYFPTTDTLAREQYGEDQHVLFGVCPREKMKPDKEHIRYLTAVWTGLDIGPDGYSGKDKHFTTEKQAIIAVKSFPLEPSIVVQSGRGLHLYWLLKEPKEVTDPGPVEDVLRRMSDFFQCSAEVSLDATFRLPATWNPKHPSHPVLCRVHHLNSSVKYDFSEFENLDVRMIIPSKRGPRTAPLMPPPMLRSRVTVLHDEEESAQVSSVVEAGSEIEQEHPHSPETSYPSFESRTQSEPSGPPTQDPSEKMAERFLENFSERLLDKLADRIVDKLLERLPGAVGKR
jgi:hypothetical protein